MADLKDKLSPEEKLLRVIQADGQTPAQPTAEEKLIAAIQVEAVPGPPPVQPIAPKPVAVAAPAPVPVVLPAAPVAPPVATPMASAEAVPVAVREAVKAPAVAGAAPAKLKMAKGAGAAVSGAVPPEKPELPVVAEDPASGLPAGAMAGRPARMHKRRRDGASWTVVNRALAAVALLLFSLSVIEILGEVRSEGLHTPEVDAEGQLLPEGGREGGVPLRTALEAFSTDVFVRAQGAGQGPAGGVMVVTSVVQSAWMPYVRENWKLMGLSRKDTPDQAEAIVLDKQQNKMQFIKVGQTVSVQGVALRLETMEGDRVRFSDGKQGLDVH